MKRVLLILIILLDIQLALADERPKWASHTPADTAKSLFFVGRSPKVSSEAEGLRMASKDAKEQLLRQEFGTTVKVDTTQTETLKNVSLDSQLSEISDLIRLRGFKQTEVYAEKENNEVEVWALFSVPKSEIKAEKGRIAEIREEKKRIAEIKRQQVKLANSVPRKENEPPPKPFNSGGKPKLRKGLKKSQVIAMFGKPRSVDHVFSESFRYNKSKYCQTILNFSCSVYFDDQGRVYGWSDFRPEYTTDLDDELTPVSELPVMFDDIKDVSTIAQSNFNNSPAGLRRLYTGLCDGGDMSGCNNLGYIESSEGNNAEAERLHKKACEGKKLDGCVDLGLTKHQQGNMSEAKRLEKRACDGGNMAGCNALGNFEQEQGNILGAKIIYKKSCDGGHMSSCDNLGLIDINNGNEKEGILLFKKACDERNFSACAHLGLVEQGNGDQSEAKKHGEKACNGGEMLGCFVLGILETKQGNLVGALSLFKQACDGGRLESCHYLGAFEFKQGDKKNAKLHLKKACDGGYKPACKDLTAI